MTDIYLTASYNNSRYPEHNSRVCQEVGARSPKLKEKKSFNTTVTMLSSSATPTATVERGLAIFVTLELDVNVRCGER